MRSSFLGFFLVATLVSTHGAYAQAPTPSASGTVLPSANPSVYRIVDSALDIWTLDDGIAYDNAGPTPSSEVILLLCYGGIVYQENAHHNWWVWIPADGAWAASSDPRAVSAGGTTIPSATQIVDSALEVWTLSDGQAVENGNVTPSSGIILLLYAKGFVYQENIHYAWWRWTNGAWAATSAPPSASPSGATIPSATQIVDSGLNIWTLSGGKAYENHAPTPSSEVILLLFYNGVVYQENIHHDWWLWSNGSWVATPSDPRVTRVFAYIGTTVNTVAVIDTGTNGVVHTVRVGFPPSAIAVTPDAKQVYVVGEPTSAPIFGPGSVSVIQTSNNAVVTTISVPYNPSGVVVSPDGSKAYVLCGLSDAVNISVSVIDTATNVVEKTIDTNDIGPAGIAISPDGKKVFLPAGGGNPPDGSLGVINTATDVESYYSVPDSLGQRYYSSAVTPNNTKLYANALIYPPDSAQITVFNATTGTYEASIPDYLTAEVFSPDSLRLFGVGLGGVAVVNTATNSGTAAVANLPGAYAVAITPDGRHLYITDPSTNSVAVADTSTYSISTIIPGVSGARPVAIVPAPSVLTP